MSVEFSDHLFWLQVAKSSICSFPPPGIWLLETAFSVYRLAIFFFFFNQLRCLENSDAPPGTPSLVVCLEGQDGILRFLEKIMLFAL